MASPTSLPTARTFLEWFKSSLTFIRYRSRVKWRQFQEHREKVREQHLTDLFNQGKHPLQVRMKLNPKFPCPACGNIDGHKIRWASALKWPNGDVGAVVTQCGLCSAAWGRQPIFAAKDWRITLSAEEARAMSEQSKSPVIEIAKGA